VFLFPSASLRIRTRQLLASYGTLILSLEITCIQFYFSLYPIRMMPNLETKELECLGRSKNPGVAVVVALKWL
jgi:hypothetical protein